MPITNPAQLKFIAEAIRPAADRIIGMYNVLLVLYQEWQDASVRDKLLLWNKIQPVANILWTMYTDSFRLEKPWKWIFSKAITDGEDDIVDGHSRPIKSKHIYQCIEMIIYLQGQFAANNDTLAKSVFIVANYNGEPADSSDLIIFMNGIGSLTVYLDDEVNGNTRRILCRETAVNPNLFDGSN